VASCDFIGIQDFYDNVYSTIDLFVGLKSVNNILFLSVVWIFDD
jgi:hypothetical protein